MRLILIALLLNGSAIACDIEQELFDLADSYVLLYENEVIGPNQYEGMIDSIFTLDSFHQTNLEIDDALLTSLSVDFMCDSLENARLGVEMIKYLHLLETTHKL